MDRRVFSYSLPFPKVSAKVFIIVDKDPENKI